MLMVSYILNLLVYKMANHKIQHDWRRMICYSLSFLFWKIIQGYWRALISLQTSFKNQHLNDYLEY